MAWSSNNEPHRGILQHFPQWKYGAGEVRRVDRSPRGAWRQGLFWRVYRGWLGNLNGIQDIGPKRTKLGRGGQCHILHILNPDKRKRTHRRESWRKRCLKRSLAIEICGGIAERPESCGSVLRAVVSASLNLGMPNAQMCPETRLPGIRESTVHVCPAVQGCLEWRRSRSSPERGIQHSLDCA
jgi:hypothetical protein